MGAGNFYDEIQNIIRESGIRQNIIAQAMDMSPAALSQIMHGLQRPTISQLCSLLDLLCVPYHQQGYIVNLLIEAKKEAGEFDSEEFEMYEKELAVDSDPRADIGTFDTFYTGEDQVHSLFQETPLNAAPVVHLASLLDYDGKTSISDFAFARLHDTIVRDYGSLGQPVVIKTCGNMIGLNYSGMVQVVICDTMVENLSNLTLQCYRNKTFHLVIHDKERASGLNDIITPPPAKAVARWSFPVLELIIIPLPSANGIHGDGIL